MQAENYTDLLVDSKWKGDGDRDEPDGDDQHQADGGLHARPERMNDDEVARHDCLQRETRRPLADSTNTR